MYILNLVSDLFTTLADMSISIRNLKWYSCICHTALQLVMLLQWWRVDSDTDIHIMEDGEEIHIISTLSSPCTGLWSENVGSNATQLDVEDFTNRGWESPLYFYISLLCIAHVIHELMGCAHISLYFHSLWLYNQGFYVINVRGRRPLWWILRLLVTIVYVPYNHNCT